MDESLNGNSTNHTSSVITPLAKKTTADDLLNMYEQEGQEESSEINKEADKQAKIQQEIPKKILADKLVKNLEKAEESLTPSDETPLGEQVEEPTQSEIKAFKAKHGDIELDIPEEAVIPVKVNNKDVSLKVKDAVAAFVRQDEFNRNMDRRVSTVTQKERRLEQELGSIKEKAESVVKLAAQGDFFPGVRALAKMAGITSNSDVVELERAMLDNLEDLRKVWSDMNPEQRNAHLANRRAEEAQKELENERAKIRKVDDESQLMSKIQHVTSQAGMDESQFWGSFKELVDNAVGEGKLFSDPREITPEHVVNFHRQVETVTKVDQALRMVEPELINQPIADEVIKLVLASDEDMSAEDIAQVVREARNAPSSTVENLNRKVEQAYSKGLRTQLKQVSSTQKAESKQLDEEMYEHFFGRRSLSPR